MDEGRYNGLRFLCNWLWICLFFSFLALPAFYATDPILGHLDLVLGLLGLGLAVYITALLDKQKRNR